MVDLKSDVDSRDHARVTGQSAGNTILTVATPAGPARRVLFATVKYSAVPVHAGVTHDLDSGAGAAWDTLLATGVANARDNVYFPDGDLKLAADDVFSVTAPAGGGVITSNIAIYTEEI